MACWEGAHGRQKDSVIQRPGLHWRCYGIGGSTRTWAQEMKALVDSEWPELVWSSGGMQTHAQSSPTGNEQDGEGGRPRHCAQPRRNAMLEGTQAMLLI